MRIRFAASLALALLAGSLPCHTADAAEIKVVATQTLTIQSEGSRSGDAAKRYLNIEGKDNGKYASFGVLIFEVPKDVDAKKLTGLTLSLVQTAPKFAKAGAIKFFLAPDLDPKSALKFEAEAADGVGKQIKSQQELGTGDFKDPEQGKSQTFKLTVNDAVKERIAKGGKLCLVIVPADGKVAATYAGADEGAKDKSPKLSLQLP